MTEQLPPKFLTTPVPANETERLAALHRYKILDTPPEAAFDRITTLAARLFQMPTALISLVDESRGWFKSRYGFDWQEMPRDATFCSFALLDDDVLMVPDAQQDVRFACNPFVLGEPGVRFYAGAPLLSHDGFNLGTLCLLDSQPHNSFSAEQQATLVDLAAMVVDELELRLATHKIAQSEEKYRSLFESIDEGFCICEMLFDENSNPIDYRFLEVNPLFEPMTGLEQATGKTIRELVPNFEADWFEIYGCVVQTGEPVRFEQQSIALNRWFDVNAFPVGEPQNHQFAVLFTNVTDRKRAEAALQESEAQTRNILESITDAFFAVDENWRFTYVNETAELLVNRTADDLIGKVFWEEFPGVNDSAFEQMHRRVMRDRLPESLIEFYPDHNRWYEVRSYPAVNGVTMYFRNVTDQIQAEEALRESEERFRTLADQMSQFAWMADANGWIFWYNRRWFDYTGTTLEEMRGWGWQQVHHPEHVARVVEHFRHCLEIGEPWEDTFPLRSKDGTYRWFLSRAIPVRDVAGNILRWFGTNTDITERLQAEQEREQLLEREQAARSDAEAANRIKDEFLAVLSHELRSPLNPILGWARLLQTGKLNAERQTEALATIERNAKLQAQLIEDLLDISRIMQGKLSLTAAPVSLTFVISAALETVRLAAEAKNIAIALDIDPMIATISGDATRLQQVVWNLLANAVKFTPNGGQITVELRQLDRLAQIRVIDTGKGIAPNFLPHVFEYFRQEDGSTTRRFGGLGLGLAIVRQIVEMHGGTVRAENHGENQGATFIVQLPAMQQAAPFVPEPTIAPANTAAPLDKIQVLLVDDDLDAREFQAFLLEQSGAKVTAVASGLEALQALERFIPEAIVSDVGMAQMDGYTLISQIRSRPPNRGGTIPAIALTAYAAEVDQQRAIGAGFQAHITKPVEPDILIKTIISLLNRNEQ
jgi:PAS domain S-box-containing protein